MVLGMNEKISKHFFSSFPNPFIYSTTIQTSDNLNNATLTICNSFGQIVKQVNNMEGQTVTLFRDNLPSGLYFIQLTKNNEIIAIEKLIITD
jgi:hypothetical protein